MERARAPDQAPARRGRFAGRRRAAGGAAEQREEEEGGLVPMLECGSCLRGFHLDCLDPPLDAVPKACCLNQLTAPMQPNMPVCRFCGRV